MPVATCIMWRPHTQPAPQGTVAVIAMQDEHGQAPYLQPDLYVRDGDLWRDEATGHELRDAVYWWAPERELLARLPRAAA